MIEIILIVLVVVLLVGMLPHWPYSQGYGWGYWPSGAFLIVLIILIIFLLQGGHRIGPL